MAVASRLDVVKRRMDDFLWCDKSAACDRLRSLLRTHFLQFPRVAIVGGMVRDIARAGKRGFNSDLDMVIDAPEDDVARLSRSIGARANSFGGHSFVADGWKLDFWAIGTTWAARTGHVEVRFLEDIVRCTFFDCDAIIYDLKDRRLVCEESYLPRIQNRTLDINLLATPAVMGNLHRAVCRILAWHASPGPRLKAFLDEHLDDSGFETLLRIERQRGRCPALLRFEDVRALRQAIAG